MAYELTGNSCVSIAFRSEYSRLELVVMLLIIFRTVLHNNNFKPLELCVFSRQSQAHLQTSPNKTEKERKRVGQY